MYYTNLIKYIPCNYKQGRFNNRINRNNNLNNNHNINNTTNK
ncbi:MAG: hypothetical protein PUC09_03220 [Methanobrevibacter wolinii]|nr:hypothetical protein [Methanobrevibacter wolinii]